MRFVRAAFASVLVCAGLASAFVGCDEDASIARVYNIQVHGADSASVWLRNIGDTLGFTV